MFAAGVSFTLVTFEECTDTCCTNAGGVLVAPAEVTSSPKVINPQAISPRTMPLIANSVRMVFTFAPNCARYPAGDIQLANTHRGTACYRSLPPPGYSTMVNCRPAF